MKQHFDLLPGLTRNQTPPMESMITAVSLFTRTLKVMSRSDKPTANSAKTFKPQNTPYAIYVASYATDCPGFLIKAATVQQMLMLYVYCFYAAILSLRAQALRMLEYPANRRLVIQMSDEFLSLIKFLLFCPVTLGIIKLIFFHFLSPPFSPQIAVFEFEKELPKYDYVFLELFDLLDVCYIFVYP